MQNATPSSRDACKSIGMQVVRDPLGRPLEQLRIFGH
jgi:hypothetical protein